MNLSPLSMSATLTHQQRIQHDSAAAASAPLNATLLIAEVHARRPIWDKKHELHNQRDLIDALWNEISVVVGVPVSRAKAKWKNLKDFFRREAKRAFTEVHYRPRWRLYQPLMFLYEQQLEFDMKDDDKGSINSSNFLEPDQTPTKFEYDYSDLHQAGEDDSRSAQSHARVRGHLQEYEDGMNSYEPVSYYHPMRNDPDAYDPDMCFFRSLVPHMKELTPQKRMQLRIRIHEMVYKEIYPDKTDDEKNGDKGQN